MTVKRRLREWVKPPFEEHVFKEFTIEYIFVRLTSFRKNYKISLKNVIFLGNIEDTKYVV